MSRILTFGCAFFVFSVVLQTRLTAKESLAAQAPAKIAVGYATISNSSLALWLAQDEKIFAKNGIDADLVFMRRLRVDAAAAEEGYADLHRAMDRKPYPSPEGLRNVQRLMALRSPKVGEVKIDNVIDNRIIRRLDESGFIDKAYAAQGMSSKP